LEGGPPSFPQGFSCLVVLRIPATPPFCPLPDSHRLRSYLPVPSGSNWGASAGPTTPPLPLTRACRFGLLPVRSPLLRESHLISSRRATEMFQFTRCPPSLPMCSAGGHQPSRWWGCPIRNLKAQRLHAAPLERFAGLRVLLRSCAPRHPPRTLCSLFSFFLSSADVPTSGLIVLPIWYDGASFISRGTLIGRCKLAVSVYMSPTAHAVTATLACPPACAE
jgi:hypothetical protein